MRGKFVVITGLDGSGTSSVSSYLHNHDKNSVLYTFPSPFAEMRKVMASSVRLSSPAAHYLFYMSANVYGSLIINDHLERGANVYSERFLIDTVVSHRAAGLPVALEYETDLYKMPVPDLTVFLSVDEKVRQERLALRSEGKGFLDKILDDPEMRSRFLIEFEKFQTFMFNVDATDLRIDEICNIIWSHRIFNHSSKSSI